MKNEHTKVDVTVIIPITERYDDIQEVFHAYNAAIASSGLVYEFIYVLDGQYPPVLSNLEALKKDGFPIKILQLARWFGEATALNVALEYASGQRILTLPAYLQVKPDELPKILSTDYNSSFVLGVRRRVNDSLINRLQSRLFHSMLHWMTGVKFDDLGCSVRLMDTSAFAELQIYGDQHRFIPLLADRQGFKVYQVPLEQSPTDAKRRIYSPGVYLRRLLDILTVFFLVKFTKKPLRFFGIVGMFTSVAGAVLLLIMAFQRLVLGTPLADRPLLLLGSILFVLGIQVLAIGLLGEIVIFAHGKQRKEYTIEKIIN